MTPPPRSERRSSYNASEATSAHTTKRRRLYWLLFLAAVGVRLLFCLVVYPRLFAARATVGSQYFFDSYREIAQSLVVTGEYRLGIGGPPAIHRPPGYTLVLAAALPTTAAAKELFQLYNAILGGLAVWATMRLAREIGAAVRRQVVAGTIVAFWPFLIWETKVTVPENLLVLLVPLLALALERAYRTGSSRLAALAGLIAGTLALTHGLYVVALGAGTIVLLFRRPFSRALTTVGRFVLAACLLVCPWIVRNTRLGYTGIATGFGLHYWKGIYTWDVLRTTPSNFFRDHDEASNNYVRALPALAGFRLDNDARSDPALNRLLDRLAVSHARQYPINEFLKTVVKAPLAWVQQQTAWRAFWNGVLVLPLLALAVRGAWRGGRALLPIMAPLLFLNLAAAAVFVEGIPMRYALPWVPLVAVLAVGPPRSAQRSFNTTR